jgi:hypothetical protein
MAAFRKFDSYAFLEKTRKLDTADKGNQEPIPLSRRSDFRGRVGSQSEKQEGILGVIIAPPQPLPDFQNSAPAPTKPATETKAGGGTRILRTLSYTFVTLEWSCPEYVEPNRWRRVVADGRLFTATWGRQAEALGWTDVELFGLHEPPAHPHASYNRMSRYDCMGLVWLLNGNPVVALTEITAAIQHKSGSVTIYRKLNKPALGPLGDSLDDFIA